MFKLSKIVVVVLVLTVNARAQVAGIFDYPLPREEYNSGKNEFLQIGTNKKAHLGEDWNNKGLIGGDSDYGDPVYCVADGVVEIVRDINYKDSWGKVLVIKHELPSGAEVFSVYAHLSEIKVRSGRVSRGQEICAIGNANGFYKGAAHLHFEIRTELWWPSDHGYASLRSEGTSRWITLADLDGYLDPTLFIGERYESSPFYTEIDNWIIVEPRKLAVPNMSYVTGGDESGESFSVGLSAALTNGWLDPIVYQYDFERGEWVVFDDFWTRAEYDFVFGPNEAYAFYTPNGAVHAVYLLGSGNNYPERRARQDVLLYARSLGLLTVDLASLDVQILENVYYRFAAANCRLDFDQNFFVIIATDKKIPLARYGTYYDYAAGFWGLDWSRLGFQFDVAP
ncbi:MAG: M23 family metallopeptidase [Patescibacteria group bacterium]